MNEAIDKHSLNDEPVNNCNCWRCVIVQRDRLTRILKNIAGHHDEQMRLSIEPEDDRRECDMRSYHQSRRNYALFHLHQTFGPANKGA